MIKLNHYELNSASAYTYFQYSLADTNALSSSLINLVNFKRGNFFTILPEEVDLREIGKFKCGGIAKGVRDQVSSFVIGQLLINSKLSCIFDDVTSTHRLGYNDPLFLSYGLTHEKEIYYLVTQKTASTQLINQCFYASNAIWHSLCVLSEINFTNNIEKKLSSKDIEYICLKAHLIIVGAYDGEGYIFWEKTH